MAKMYIEVDQAIYSKLLDAMFKICKNGHDKFLEMIPRIGGFHIIMCMLKTIFLRCKDSEIIELFVYSGISGEATIKHALWWRFKIWWKHGGDVKFGTHLCRCLKL